MTRYKTTAYPIGGSHLTNRGGQLCPSPVQRARQLATRLHALVKKAKDDDAGLIIPAIFNAFGIFLLRQF